MPRHKPFLLALACLLSAAARSAEKPNILFIAVDDLRPEMGCYGNSVIKTPHLDRLAATGMVFNRAYCQQAVCSPSRSSIMTGRRPDSTGVYDLETHFRKALPDVVTLPQLFRQNGYHTAACGKIYHNGYEDGLSWSEPHWYPSGITVDTDPKDWSKRLVVNIPGGVSQYAAPVKGKGDAYEVSPKADDELPDGHTTSEAIKRLSQLKTAGKPFLLAVGLYKPHLPFVAPKKYWDLYDPEKIHAPATDKMPEGTPEFVGHKNGELHSYDNVPKGNPIPADFAKNLRHGYYACVSYTDAQVGRLLAALEKDGLSENTIVVLWGDHGWQLGEHGLWHKHTNFEIAARAPLIIRWPQAKTAGKACPAPVEFVDVYPTLAELAGLTPPADLEGKSLKNYLENPAAPMAKVAISQYPRGGAALERYIGNSESKGNLMGYSIRDTRWRLTLWRDQKNGRIIFTELYDEKNDPNETVNVAGVAENASVIENLSRHLPPMPSGASPASSPGSAPKPKSFSQEEIEKRVGFFKKRDANGDGRLTREEFMKNHPNGEAAKPRFDLWDTNKDGFLSQDEYVYAGTK